MGDVSLEEPSNALEDWHEYLASMGPVNALFDRLGMDRSDIRVATQLNWSRRNLTDADCHVIADIFRANSAYTINPLVGMFSLNHNNVERCVSQELVRWLGMPLYTIYKI